MERTTFKLTMRPRWVTGLVENVQEYLRRETGVEYSRDVVERSLEEWLEARFDGMLERIGDVITSTSDEAVEFRRILEQNAAVAAGSKFKVQGSKLAEVPAAEAATVARGDAGVPVDHAPDAPAGSIFSGKRGFDASKLGAMVAYLVEKGHDIYKTNLNKLLFYSDMTAYFLRGEGISGATYVNMPFGPVPDHVEAVIDALVTNGTLTRRDVPEIGKNAVRFEMGYEGVDSELSEDDRRVLDWVLTTYGDMGAGELSELSHRERAYKDTRPLEPIAYEYAKFLRRLPSKDGEQ